MKTQIIRRLFLIVFALFICINNQGSKMQSGHTSASSSINLKHATQQNSNHDNQDKQSVPYIPDTHHDHDFDCFDFRHIEKRVLWRCIANKAFAFIYHLAVLLALIAQFLIH